MSGARTSLLLALTGLAATLALAVGQVPQPWRALLVAWLLVLLPLLLLAAQALRLHIRYQARRLEQESRRTGVRRSARRPTAERAPRRPSDAGLRIISTNSAPRGRRTI